MALSVKVPRKKKALPKRTKFGLPGCPTDKGFKACKYYFHFDVDRKILSEISKSFIKTEFTRDEARLILSNPEYHFSIYTHLIAAIYWNLIGQEFDVESAPYFKGAKAYYRNLIGRATTDETTSSDGIPKPVKATINPQELLARKVQSTVMIDIDTLEDSWIAGEKTDALKLYELFKSYELKGMAVPLVRKRLESWFTDYDGAVNKTCCQMVEGYSHIPKLELKRRLNVVNAMISDLDKIKAATKAVRQVRVPKARAADKQIQKLQYAKESPEYKLMSVNPVQLPGAYRLITFNTKTRALTEYVSSSTSGFEVKGTTISNIDSTQSRSVRLRKPEDFIKIALTKTPKQIDNEWSNLTTKTTENPNGRINVDTILLRIMDK